MSETEETNFWNGYSIVINSIIGPGVLAIPWAYSKGGILLGLSCQLVTSFTSLVLTYQLLQVMSRLEIIKEVTKNGYQVTPPSLLQLFQTTKPEDFIQEEAFSENQSLLSEKPKISEENTDLTEMTLILLGKYNGYFFCFTYVLSVFGTLMAYSSVFASSLASAVPIFTSSTCNIYEDEGAFGNSCWRKYWFYIFVFVSVSGILTLIGLKRQALFQNILTVMRFFVLSVMLITALMAFSANKNLDNSGENNGNFKFFDLEQFSLTFPIVLLANIFHPNIPNAVYWVKNKNKQLTRIIFFSVLTVSVFYLLMGVVLPLCVDDVEQQVSLNWIDYTGGKDEQKWWSYCVMYIVLLFPPLEIISGFPISSISLADNILTIFNADKYNESLENTSFIFTRLAVVFFPIISAAFYFDLGRISQFTGVLIVISLGIYVPLLAQAAKKIVPQEGVFDNCFSSPWAIWGILVVNILFSVVCLIFTIYKTY